jgi:hypothetical protein
VLFASTGNYLSSQAVSSQVLSAYRGLTAVFGMGTGGTPQLSPPDKQAHSALALMWSLSSERSEEHPSIKFSGDSYGDPPVPIPNTAVKPVYAESTWLVTAREDR